MSESYWLDNVLCSGDSLNCSNVSVDFFVITRSLCPECFETGATLHRCNVRRRSRFLTLSSSRATLVDELKPVATEILQIICAKWK